MSGKPKTDHHWRLAMAKQRVGSKGGHDLWPSLPMEASNVRVFSVGGTGSWLHIAIFLSWWLIQPGNFL